MRVQIDVDTELMSQALAISRLKSETAVAEAALRMLIRLKQKEEILRLARKVHWRDDLDGDP